jgi:type IV pilus assembly protein PilW
MDGGDVEINTFREDNHMGNKGFTLVEIMVTLALSGIVMASIYTAFLSQQRSYLAQEQVSAMQQNIRAGLDIMTREIRMAGFDPTQEAGAGITTASAGQISFTQDITNNTGTGDSDGDVNDPGENITYSLYTTDGIKKLGRNNQPVAENIEQLEFYYTLANGTQKTIPSAAELAEIKSVQISILAKAGRPDRNFINTATYTSASGVNWGPAGDNYRRRLRLTTVQCRNMGL